MIKRTLIAIAVVALLATSAHAALQLPDYFGPFGDDYAVKVDGSDKPTIRWPYEIKYTALTVCTIPIKMHVGMYVQIEDCKKKKIVLQQVDCGDLPKNADHYPCYIGCVKFRVRSNFDVKMGQSLHKAGDIPMDWSCSYKDGDVVTGDGDWHEMQLCVKAWKAQIYRGTPGDEVNVGSVDITVKPNT